MKRSECIMKYYDDISAAMVEHYRLVLGCNGRIQYKIYIWEDGEIESLQGVQGDSDWLQPRDGEPRELYYVCKVDSPHFDPWEISDSVAPEDDEQAEAERKEIIDQCVDDYESGIDGILSMILEDAKREEEEQDRYDEWHKKGCP